MNGKLGVLPKTISSNIVIDGLRSLSTLNGRPISDGLYLIVGGTAVQTYLPKTHRRPTSDIDLSILRPLNYADFKVFAAPAIEFLRDEGYDVSTKKGSSNFKIMAFTRDNTDCLMIEFSRRSKKKFDEKKERLERELENGRYKSVTGTESSYLVASPEDIVVPKLVRGVGTLSRQPLLAQSLQQICSGETDLARMNQLVIEERAIARMDGSPKRYEESRLKADMYDVLCLDRFAGFNQGYLEITMNDWEKTQKSSLERDTLFEIIKIRK